MAHFASKLPACANCSYAFTAAENFCPDCGQQNHPLDLSFGHVAEEVLEGVFHFDGKVFRTLRQLLFAPGTLTLRFWEGKRVAYVPPVRLYVFISFLFFLLLSLAMHAPEHGEASTIGEQMRQTSIRFRADSTRLSRTVAGSDSARIRLLLRESRQIPMLGGRMHWYMNSDTSDYRRWQRILFTPHEWSQLPALSATQLDSVFRLHGQAPTTRVSRFMLRQSRRIGLSTEQELSHQFVRGVSLMMFVLMPLFALLLKLLYLRRQRYYLGHLMFSIHLHCFVFLLFSLTLALSLFAHTPGTLILWLWPLLALYLFLALRNTYQQSWLKTTVKFLLLTGVYLVVIVAGLAGALGLGLVLV